MTTVYYSECLESRHPDVALSLKMALDNASIPHVVIHGTGSIWARDFMPIRAGDHYVKFRPKADIVRWPFLAVPDSCWNFLPNVIQSDLVCDGGNVVRSPDGKRVIMTDQVYRDNGGTDKFDPLALADMLEAEILWIPVAPGDDLGHADGEVAFIRNDLCFINDTRSLRDAETSAHSAKIKRILNYHGIETVPMPWAYDQCRDISEERFRQEHPLADEKNEATGYFINFAKWDNLICYPTFGIDRDERCLDALLDAFPGANCVGIDCGYLAEEGGLLHCVTAEF
jgi:agmatine deiminase